MFLCILATLLFGITAGKNTILYDKLMKCVQQHSSNLRETYLQSSWCGDIMFSHCYKYGTVKPVLQDECGFIESPRGDDFNTHTWQIRVMKTVWINVLEFDLYFC